jgi:putative transcriptional regulator
MTIRHHLTDNLLMAYSAGQLPEAFNLVVATHLSMCDDCRAYAESFDALGGAMLMDEPAAAMSDESLATTMERIAGLTPVAAKAPAPGILPAPLRDYIGGDLADVQWRPVGMGVRQAILPTAKGSTVRLLHIPAGAAVPDHGHRGMELTLVLQGAFRDATDRFGPGDVEIATEELNHKPVAEAGLDCICLAATDAPLRFNAFLPRMLQPFFRI